MPVLTEAGSPKSQCTFPCNLLESLTRGITPSILTRVSLKKWFRPGVQPTINRALDALFVGLTTVVKQAASELGVYATEDAIVARATKKLACMVDMCSHVFKRSSKIIPAWQKQQIITNQSHLVVTKPCNQTEHGPGEDSTGETHIFCH